MYKLLYLLFNLFVLVPPLVLAIKYKERGVLPKLVPLLWAIGLVSVPFILWDIWAASEGHWDFNDRYVLGWYVAGIPLEEILFFVTVPFACLFSLLAIRYHSDKQALVKKFVPLTVIGLITISAVLLFVFHRERGYTVSAMLASLVTSAFFLRSRLVGYSFIWKFQLALLGLFLVANSILTAVPIITYGDAGYIGWRVGTIPLEDFFFNYSLITLFILVYEWRSRVAKLKHK